MNVRRVNTIMIWSFTCWNDPVL